jgi:hypothetical protein
MPPQRCLPPDIASQHGCCGTLFLVALVFLVRLVIKRVCRGETRHGLPLQIPAVRDILVGKLHRRRQPGQTGVVPKDLRAFERVRELTGHPTEDELLADILLCPHAWQLSLSGTVSDFRLNLEDLWPVFYSKPLDVGERIIRPLLHELELAGYNEGRDWQELIRALSSTRP